MSKEKEKRARTTEMRGLLLQDCNTGRPGHPRGSTNFENTSTPSYFFLGPSCPSAASCVVASTLSPSPSFSLFLFPLLSSVGSFARGAHEKSVRRGGKKEGVLSVIVATFPAATRKGSPRGIPYVRPSVVRPSRGRRREERRRATPNSQPTGRVNRVDIVPRE